MFLHEANEIDKCLYCSSDLEIQYKNWQDSVGDTILKCNSCGEEIRFYNFLSVKVVLVSCKDLFIICDFSDVYQVANASLTSKTVEIPIFDVNFSDKEKLYSKLKTYLTFG